MDVDAVDLPRQAEPISYPVEQTSMARHPRRPRYGTANRVVSGHALNLNISRESSDLSRQRGLEKPAVLFFLALSEEEPPQPPFKPTPDRCFSRTYYRLRLRKPCEVENASLNDLVAPAFD